MLSEFYTGCMRKHNRYVCIGHFVGYESLLSAFLDLCHDFCICIDIVNSCDEKLMRVFGDGSVVDRLA